MANEPTELDQIFLAAITASSDSADMDFVADFVGRMFGAAFFARSNCKKAALHSIFQAAVEDVALGEDEEYCAAEKLAKLIARVDVSNGAAFKDGIIAAFARSGFSQFKELRAALEKAQADESMMALRRLLIPRRQALLDVEAAALMKKRAPMRRNPKIRVPQLPPFPK